MQKFDEAAHGVYVIAATPFTETGQVDMNSVASLVDFYLEEKVHGMTVLGVMGEAPKLTDSEQIALLKRYLARVDERVPVVVGVSNPGIENLASLSKASMDAGADGVMIAGIPGLKTDDQIFSYFDKVMAKLDTGTPVCLQITLRLSSTFSVTAINSLIDAYDNIVMFKHEDCPGHRKLTQVRRAPKPKVLGECIVAGNCDYMCPKKCGAVLTAS